MKQALEMKREYSKKPFYQYFNLNINEIFLNYLVNKKKCVIDKNAQILTEKEAVHDQIIRYFKKNDYWGG